MTEPDFAVRGRIAVRSVAELVDAMRDERALRLGGRGEHQGRVPAPAGEVTLLTLAGLDRIARLDPGDLTCSVEAGVTRAQLDAELARHRLILPCAGQGTLGSLFARGEHAALSPTALAPRNVLLGLDGVLRDGTTFKVGARVVKSVAGFDLQRTFVGSRGRLFAATTLHLKLRPTPRAQLRFANGELSRAQALALWRDLRRLPSAPSELLLTQRGDRCAVVGSVDGAAAHVAAVQRAFALREGGALDLDPPRPSPRHELIDGLVQPSALRRLLDTLPADAEARCSGSGQFRVWLLPNQTDALLAMLPNLPGGCGEVRCGDAARRGKHSGEDTVTADLEAALRRELDPRGLLR